MHNIILILGAANDQFGNLNRIAEDRLLTGFRVYTDYGGKFLCTGGFGERFNRAPEPHAYYASNYLIKLGVPIKDIMNIVVSSNTVDDLRLAKDIIDQIQPLKLFLVTSNFHMERVKLIHDILINYPYTEFVEAKSNLSYTDLIPFLIHEKRALEEIRKNNNILY